MPSPVRVSSAISRPLHSVASTRQLERLAAAGLPPHTLMQRAGLAVARLALALAPHAQRIWIACGPGNNGGDGFEAALHLHRSGKEVVLTWTGAAPGRSAMPADARASRERALAAGVTIAEQPPHDFDFCIDALLGIGASLDANRPGGALMQQWLGLMQGSGKPSLAVDIPTGLDADSGCANALSATEYVASSRVNTLAASRFTLSLLTLKAGLFTAEGRDWAGEVWFDDLGLTHDMDAGDADTVPPSCWLLGRDRLAPPMRANAAHASHKGTFGDVAVVGGESTERSHMAGAALLAASAALHAGAGRVLVALLGDAGLKVDVRQPELMFRSFEALDPRRQVVVCGCGGGEAIRSVLPVLLSLAARLVIDADALNAIAADTALQAQLKARHGRGFSTVLTPHPLEAARLAETTATLIQRDRLAAAGELAEKFQCVVVLKGSGTVIAAPKQCSMINSSGNALLATAGTGDVLAGMTAAYLAGGLDAFEAACRAVFVHGHFAEEWLSQKPGQVLTASTLAAQQLNWGR
jgi:ADP-dependent NAD(P)H-hydrate dehydratase / NAD(P)H-hydrate epimerase